MDWTNPDEQVSKHFKVSEAITLHAWNRLAIDADGLTDEIKDAIVATCNKMDEIRDFLGCSMNAHCIFRSVEYNEQVLKSLPHDVHSMGEAIDFDCNGTFTIDELHAKLEPVLEQYGIRMERGTTSWIHLDTRAPGPSGRYFTA